MGPAPPILTGLHRYQWELYQQDIPTDDLDLIPGPIRGGCNVEEFLEVNRMTDDLVASFQFLAQYEG